MITKQLTVGISEATELGQVDLIKISTTNTGGIIIATDVPKNFISLKDLKESITVLEKFIEENKLSNQEVTDKVEASSPYLHVTHDEVPF